MAKLLVIQHVPHERLGTFEDAFRKAGCSIARLNTYERSIRWPSIGKIDGLVVMGGPMSLREQAKYPFLKRELILLKDVLNAGYPILGICLGAQLLAHVLGARVMKAKSPEIGWFPVTLQPEAKGDALLSIFRETEMVLQWHTDTYALPSKAVRLASSPLCLDQAFRYRDNVYGLQFHPEMTEAMIRAWMRTPANKEQFARLRGVVDPMVIRRESRQYINRLQALSNHVASTFCRFLTKRSVHA